MNVLIHYATAKGTMVDGTLWFVESYSDVLSNACPQVEGK